MTKISHDIKDSFGMVKTMHFPQPFPFVLESMKPIIEEVENELDRTNLEEFKRTQERLGKIGLPLIFHV